MTKNITPFFATSRDMVELLTRVSLKRDLKFVVSGLFDTQEIQSSTTVSKINSEINYLVADHDLFIETRVVPQRKGGEKFAVDQLANQKTVVLRPGGRIEDSCLVAGQIGTASEDPISLQIYKLFLTEIRSQFNKIKSYYVGPEASCLLDEGVRLTTNPKASKVYDLKR